MPRRFSTAEVLRALGKVGIVPVRQRGSHIQLKGEHRERQRVVTVQANQRELKPRDIASILRQAGLSRYEFERLLGEREL